MDSAWRLLTSGVRLSSPVPRAPAPSPAAAALDTLASEEPTVDSRKRPRAPAVTADEAMCAFRRRLGISVSGDDVPACFARFSSLPPAGAADTAEAAFSAHALRCSPLSTRLRLAAMPPAAARAALLPRRAAIRRALLAAVEASSYAEPTAVQMQALPALLCGRDVLAVAPTGSGKTAAFGIALFAALLGHDASSAALGGAPRALVIVPTDELAAQSVRALALLGAGSGVRVAALTSEAAASAASHRVDISALAGDLSRPKKRRRREAPGAAGEGEGAAEAAAPRAAAPPPGADVGVFAVPPLPRVDVLVATPLLLVAALRRAAAAVPAFPIVTFLNTYANVPVSQNH